MYSFLSIFYICNFHIKELVWKDAIKLWVFLCQTVGKTSRERCWGNTGENKNKYETSVSSAQFG